MHFSAFTKYWTENRNNVPAAFANEIRREAVKRVTERYQAARADCELCFADLRDKMETKISGKI